ncbi:MAG: hypothetical protein JXB17_12835, partial [Bacteroidales bacterium]|nr:hypothetical protein [Bacteroidales bacterium]
MKQKNHLKQLLSAFLLFLFILLEGAGFAQQRTITGTIIGADEAPLPGVSVVIKGTTQGTITDLDGK